MGHFYQTLNTSGEWLCQHGVESDAAAKYITEFYKTVLAEAVDRAQDKETGIQGFSELVQEQTPGGLNEAVIREMRNGQAYECQSQALENAFKKLSGIKL